MASREDLGADWTEIISEWYLGRSPNITAEDGWAALGAVGRLWPERISSLTARANRGSIIIAPEVDLGITLLACEHLPGFDAVLDRMKLGERSAATEAYVLAALIRAGYSVLVEPKVGGKKPDAAVQIDSELVYIEVVVPDESAEHQRVASLLGGLADRLLDQHPGVSMDVFLLVEPTIEVVDSICDLVERAAAAPDGKVHELPGVGFAQAMPFLDSIALPLALPDPPDPGIPDLPSTGVLSFGFRSEGQVLAVRFSFRDRAPMCSCPSRTFAHRG